MGRTLIGAKTLAPPSRHGQQLPRPNAESLGQGPALRSDLAVDGQNQLHNRLVGFHIHPRSAASNPTISLSTPLSVPNLKLVQTCSNHAYLEPKPAGTGPVGA